MSLYNSKCMQGMILDALSMRKTTCLPSQDLNQCTLMYLNHFTFAAFVAPMNYMKVYQVYMRRLLARTCQHKFVFIQNGQIRWL